MKKTRPSTFRQTIGSGLFLAIICGLMFFVGVFTISAQQTRQLDRQTTDNTQTQSRTALVIGNGSYADSPLNNPPNDATDMAAALKKLNFEVLSFTNLDQNGMKKAIRDFGTKLRTKGGVGLFYYAGHGVQVKGVNYLIPVSAQVRTEEEIEYESVEVGLVLAQMESAKNNLNIVILDACRNNPFARSFRSADKGLASIDAPSGTLLAYSTAPGSVASDGTGRNGLYTQELLKAIRSDGLSIEDIFKRVRVSVRLATFDKQTPWESSSLTGDFYFSPSKTKVADSTNPKTKTDEKLPSAEQVLEKYFQSIGGKTAMRNLQSLSRRGELEIIIGGNKFTGTILEVWKTPNKSYVEMKIPNTELAQEGYDGTTGWSKGELGYAEMSGQQLEVKKRSSALNFIADAAEFKKLYPQINLKGKETLNEKVVFVIEASPTSGKPNLFYFDSESGLLMRLDFFSESEFKKGVLLLTQAYFEEYNEINGVMLPFVFREINSLISTTVKFNPLSVKFNNPINDTTFQPPKDKSKVLTDSLKNLDEANDLIAEASRQAAQKNYDEAIKIYTKAIEVYPNSYRSYNQRGLIYSLKGQFDKAIADHSAAIKLDPDNSVYYFNRGMAYYSKNDFNPAIEDFNKAIKLNSNSVNYYSSRCAAFFILGKNNQALDDCTKAIELDMTKASLYLDRAVVYERMGRKDLADADRRKYKELGGK